jgi:hypothetical protein
MRNFLFAISISFAFSLSWGFTNKSKSQRAVLPKSSQATESFANSLNESYLKMAIRGDNYETQFVKANVFVLKFDYFLKYHVNPRIYTKIHPVARLYSGHVQSIDAQEKTQNSISILNAAVYGEWMKESYVAMGIFDQQETFSSLLVDDRMAFIGGQAKQSMVTAYSTPKEKTHDADVVIRWVSL